MTDYTELIKELRYCVDGDEECAGCKRYGQMSCEVYLMEDAADAIEELILENKLLAESLNKASELFRKRQGAHKD